MLENQVLDIKRSLVPKENINSLEFALSEARTKLIPELQGKVVVGLKVDEQTNVGLLQDVKEKLRDLNMVKIIYITAPGNDVQQ